MLPPIWLAAFNLVSLFLMVHNQNAMEKTNTKPVQSTLNANIMDMDYNFTVWDNLTTIHPRITDLAWVNPFLPQPCNITTYPYYAYIMLEPDEDTETCGGAILTRRLIMTTGHCCKGISLGSVAVYVGYNGSDYDAKVDVASFVIHPHFFMLDHQTEQVREYDACLLKLDSLISVSNRVQPIQIASPSVMEEMFNDSWSTVEIIGMGLKYWPESTYADSGNSPILHCERFTVQPSRQCEFFRKKFNGELTFCTQSSKANYGSPVIYKNMLVGLSSSGCRAITYHSRIDALEKWLHLSGLRSRGTELTLQKGYVYILLILISFRYLYNFI